MLVVMYIIACTQPRILGHRCHNRVARLQLWFLFSSKLGLMLQAMNFTGVYGTTGHFLLTNHLLQLWSNSRDPSGRIWVSTLSIIIILLLAIINLYLMNHLKYLRSFSLVPFRQQLSSGVLVAGESLWHSLYNNESIYHKACLINIHAYIFNRRIFPSRCC